MSSPATAQLTSLSPFNGAISESWETFPNYLAGGALPNGSSIFSGAASIAHAGGGDLGVYEPTGGVPFGLGLYPAQVYDGTKGGGFVGSSFVTITFANPISDFGAYWAAFINSEEADSISISFQTVGGVTFATQTFQYAAVNGALQWQGWHSSVPIESVTFTSSRLMAFDGLQANAVPEPTAVVLGAIGLIGLAILRRKGIRR